MALALALVVGGLVTGTAPAGATVGCGSTITTDTTLTSDLSCPGDGLVVTGSGVTLDLGGHILRGAGFAADGAGVRVVGSGTTVRNGRVENFRYGVYLGGDDTDVTRLALVGNTDGAHVRSFSNHVRGNAVSLNSSAMLLIGGGNHIEGNALRQNEGGIFVAGPANHIRANSIVGENGDDNGIVAFGADTTIVGNSVSHYRGLAGITMPGTGQIHGNHVFSNVNGIVVSGSASVSGNRTFLNSDDGIEVVPGGSAVLQGNTADQNGDLGIEASGNVVDGGGNRASGNGNPLQCVGVVCV